MRCSIASSRASRRWWILRPHPSRFPRIPMSMCQTHGISANMWAGFNFWFPSKGAKWLLTFPLKQADKGPPNKRHKPLGDILRTLQKGPKSNSGIALWTPAVAVWADEPIDRGSTLKRGAELKHGDCKKKSFLFGCSMI